MFSEYSLTFFKKNQRIQYLFLHQYESFFFFPLPALSLFLPRFPTFFLICLFWSSFGLSLMLEDSLKYFMVFDGCFTVLSEALNIYLKLLSICGRFEDRWAAPKPLHWKKENGFCRVFLLSWIVSQ